MRTTSSRWALGAWVAVLSFPAHAAAKAPANVSFGVRQPLLIMTVDDQGTEPSDRELHEIVYEPKVPTIGEVSGSFRGLSLGYSHNLDGEDEDELDYTDYRAGLYYAQFGIDASYTEFEHFRIAEQQGFEDRLEDRNVKRLSMASRFTTANIYWLPLRLNYELAESLDPATKKRTGAGTGLVASYSNSGIDTPGGLIPKPWQAAFGPDGQFESGSLTSLNLQAAFALTLAPGPFYLAALVTVGAGQQSFEYKADTETRQGEGEADKIGAQVTAGYSADRTFLAVRYGFESPRYVLKHMSISAESSDLSARFGLKF